MRTSSLRQCQSSRTSFLSAAFTSPAPLVFQDLYIIASVLDMDIALWSLVRPPRCEEHPLLTTSAPSDDEWESLSAIDRSEPLYNILEEDLTEIDDALGPMRSPDVVETHVVDGHEVALSLWRVPWSHPVRDLLCVGVQPAPGWRAPDSRGGRLAVEHQLSEAPDALRSFMLGNIMPGVDADGHSINKLGLGLERLQFCESAFVVGSLVTCVGEIDRDREGVLFISPWRPP